jgi:hypothetical protein
VRVRVPRFEVEAAEALGEQPAGVLARAWRELVLTRWAGRIPAPLHVRVDLHAACQEVLEQYDGRGVPLAELMERTHYTRPVVRAAMGGPPRPRYLGIHGTHRAYSPAEVARLVADTR